MKTSYLVMEDVEQYSVLGGVSMNDQTPLATFTSKRQAVSYIRKNSKPHRINSFPPLEYGKLQLKKIVSNPTVPVNKLPNYKNASNVDN